MTYRDNKVVFSLFYLPIEYTYPDYKHKIISMRFILQDFNITSGQDPSNKIKAGSIYTGNNGFTFSIGRKGSESVAKWFNDKIKNGHTTFNHTAGELNFALYGELQIEFGQIETFNKKTFCFPETILAQGHAGASNNWWFGGNKDYSSSTTDRVKCTGRNVADINESYSFSFERGGNGVNVIDIRLASDFTWR